MWYINVALNWFFMFPFPTYVVVVVKSSKTFSNTSRKHENCPGKLASYTLALRLFSLYGVGVVIFESRFIWQPATTSVAFFIKEKTRLVDKYFKWYRKNFQQFWNNSPISLNCSNIKNLNHKQFLSSQVRNRKLLENWILVMKRRKLSGNSLTKWFHWSNSWYNTNWNYFHSMKP